MDRIRLILAVIAAKLILLFCRITGSRGSATPGKYARALCPQVIALLAAKVKKGIIVVCGTNGKTTTNNLINAALVQAGYKTVCNNAGANMLNGIAAAFCKGAGLFGTMRADYACIEADEANLPLLFAQAKPDIIVVTNLFRDQLDRYGEIDLTAQLLKKAFDMAPDAKLILNADDPVTSVFGDGRSALYYGVKNDPHMRAVEEIRDGSNCQKCGAPLDYTYYLYGQIGQYQCPKCGYKNPQAAYDADHIRIENGILHFDVCKGGFVSHAESEVTGLYNVYNMLMAYAALDVLGLDSKSILSVLCAQKPEPGRMSRFDIGEKTVYLLLSKNPTGFNQSVTTVINDTREKDILLILNDNPQDGEDISWIWDVDFETLRSAGAGRYTLTGTRRYDMYLRLKYAGYDTSRITVCDTTEAALEHMLDSGRGLCYALVNYTAMYPAYVALNKLAKEGR